MLADLSVALDDSVAVAVANPPSAIVAPQPNWIGNDPPGLMDALMDSIRNGTDFGDYRYLEQGANRMPSLTVNVPVDYYGRNSENNRGYWEFATIACATLDRIAGQAGAFGPQCTIAQVLKSPTGRLELVTREGMRPGSYLYTPASVGLDRFRFVLDNGAGRRVEVTFSLNAIRKAPEP